MSSIARTLEIWTWQYMRKLKEDPVALADRLAAVEIEKLTCDDESPAAVAICPNVVNIQPADVPPDDVQEYRLLKPIVWPQSKLKRRMESD